MKSFSLFLKGRLTLFFMVLQTNFYPHCGYMAFLFLLVYMDDKSYKWSSKVVLLLSSTLTLIDITAGQSITIPTWKVKSLNMYFTCPSETMWYLRVWELTITLMNWVSSPSEDWGGSHVLINEKMQIKKYQNIISKEP